MQPAFTLVNAATIEGTRSVLAAVHAADGGNEGIETDVLCNTSHVGAESTCPCKLLVKDIFTGSKFGSCRFQSAFNLHACLMSTFTASSSSLCDCNGTRHRARIKTEERVWHMFDLTA